MYRYTDVCDLLFGLNNESGIVIQKNKGLLKSIKIVKNRIFVVVLFA